MYHLRPVNLKDLTLYSEFLLSVQDVMGKGRVNSWVGGIWHQGNIGSSSVSWASYYLAGFILQPKYLCHSGGILKMLTLNLEQLKSEGLGAAAVLVAPEQGAQGPDN